MIRTRNGDPYSVFAPFWKACNAAPPPRLPLSVPERINRSADLTGVTRLEMDELALLPKHPDWASGLRAAWRPGEASAQRALADFFDGFGGGTSRERILSIMKDSHIGSYGVIGLILYFALLYTLLSSLPLTLAGSAILAGDPFSKGVAGMIINRLPYARKEEEAKNKTVYSRMTTSEYTCCLFSALIPMFWLPEPVYYLAGLLPILVFCSLTYLMKKKIQGYTGDCCGATFLLCELSFYLGIALIYTTLI